MLNFISLVRSFKAQPKPFVQVPSEPVQVFHLDNLTQVQRVLTVMKNGDWLTLEEISVITGDTTPSISARLRDLRKPKFGAYIVERRKVHESLYEYRVTV